MPVALHLDEVLGRFVAVSESLCPEARVPIGSDQVLAPVTRNLDALWASIGRCKELSDSIAFDSRYLSLSK